jgi:hypothetical protein
MTLPYNSPKEIWMETPEYALLHWRNVPQEDENALDSFMTWIEKDNLDEADEVYLPIIKGLVDQYLGRDMKKIKQAEQERLEKWIKSTTGEK